jgi:uncharacterized membrane protein
MNRTLTNATRISAAIGLAMGLQMAPAFADDMQKGDMSKDAKAAMNEKMEKCYGINATGKNDCAAGAHSCAGQASRARDPDSFVLLPAGACKKIEGGKTK